MRISLHAISVLVLAIALFQCRSNQAQHRAVDQTLRQILGQDYRKLFNDQKTHALAFSVHPDSTGYTPYAVVELSKNRVLLKGTYSEGGFAQWADNQSIRVLTIPGYVTKVPDSTVYIRTIFLDQRQADE